MNGRRDRLIGCSACCVFYVYVRGWLLGCGGALRMVEVDVTKRSFAVVFLFFYFFLIFDRGWGKAVVFSFAAAVFVSLFLYVFGEGVVVGRGGC